MNKGVELLITRRETHPQEFRNSLERMASSRWEALLRNFNISLDKPATYPVGEAGEIFTRVVMSRLLEGDFDGRDSWNYAMSLSRAMQRTKERIAADLITRMYHDE